MKKIIDLTWNFSEKSPHWDYDNYYKKETFLNYNQCTSEVEFKIEGCSMKFSCGTHIDSPAHCFEGGITVDKIPLENLIDVPLYVIWCSGERENYKGDLDPENLITLEHVKNFENQYEKIKEKSFVIFFTAWSFRWTEWEDAFEKNCNKELIDYINNYKFPYIDKKVAYYLVKKNVYGIGIDTPSPDRPETGFDCHEILLKNNKYIVENISNDVVNMPRVGGFVSILPIKFKDTTEAPVRIFGYY